VVADSLKCLVTEGLELEVLELATFDCAFDAIVVMYVLVFNAELAVLQEDNQRVTFESHIAQVALHDCRQLHDLDRRVHFLFGVQLVELEFGVQVGVLLVLQNCHELVLCDCLELLELFAQGVSHITVEHTGDLVVHV